MTQSSTDYGQNVTQENVRQILDLLCDEKLVQSLISANPATFEYVTNQVYERLQAEVRDYERMKGIGK